MEQSLTEQLPPAHLPVLPLLLCKVQVNPSPSHTLKEPPNPRWQNPFIGKRLESSESDGLQLSQSRAGLEGGSGSCLGPLRAAQLCHCSPLLSPDDGPGPGEEPPVTAMTLPS